MRKDSHAAIARRSLAAVLLSMGLGQVHAQAVAVLSSHDLAPYAEAVRGYKTQWAAVDRAPGHLLYELKGDAGIARDAANKSKQASAKVVIALGALATRVATQADSAWTVISVMTLSTDNDARNAAVAIPLDIPPEMQLNWLAEALPKHRTIGILFTPAESLGKLDDLARIAKQKELRLVPIPVSGPQELPNSLEKLAKQADLLWAMPDAGVFNPQSIQPILLFCFRNKIPVMGLSSTWVKAGALFALEWDYEDIGRQSGELALQSLNGTLSPGLRVTPRKMTYSVNSRTASHLNVNLSRKLLAGAKQVFE